MMKQIKEFSYFYFDELENLVMVDSLSEVPKEIEDYCTIWEATTQMQKLGCAGISLHKIESSSSTFNRLCFTVTRLAVEELGEIFPKVLRGVRSPRPDSEYKILFGTSDEEVAAFYGTQIKVYENVKGYRIKDSIAKSVVTGDWDNEDDEIIFFPLSVTANHEVL